MMSRTIAGRKNGKDVTTEKVGSSTLYNYKYDSKYPITPGINYEKLLTD